MQIVKYKWMTQGMGGEPFFFTKDNGKTGRIKLFDESLHIKIGGKHCTGYVKNGRQVDCPKSRLVIDDRMCRECALNDDFFLCIKCTGEECMNDGQRPSCMENNYYIYLAAFSNMLKVGISHEHRVLERLIEQGADMGAKIGLVKDGKLVRTIEQKIRAELGICDRVTGAEKQKMIFCSPNVASANIFNAYNKLKLNGLSQHLMSPEIYDLQSVYRLGRVDGMPKAVHTSPGHEIRGDVIAAKGNIIILRNESGLFSVNSHRLIGCDVEILN